MTCNKENKEVTGGKVHLPYHEHPPLMSWSNILPVYCWRKFSVLNTDTVCFKFWGFFAIISELLTFHFSINTNV